MNNNLKNTATFGVAGNFTGHLEQAGEAVDFKNVKTSEADAPKAIFPTYIPGGNEKVPDYLKIYPFDSEKILFPKGEQKLQIEPECAIVFNAEWKEGQLVSLEPVEFGASNDCSIRKEGAKKISQKKNWGNSTKGFAENTIKINSFDSKGILNRYRIASYLVRGNEIYQYGEDSAVRDYSYVYEKLVFWMIDKFNNQKDEGPAENIHSYLEDAGFPEKIMVSIGATRYTVFGEHNFLQDKDLSVVILYPEDVYTKNQIEEMLKSKKFNRPDISVLMQEVIL